MFYLLLLAIGLVSAPSPTEPLCIVLRRAVFGLNAQQM